MKERAKNEKNEIECLCLLSKFLAFYKKPKNQKKSKLTLLDESKKFKKLMSKCLNVYSR